MKKMIVVFSVLAMILVPNVSFSQHETERNLKDYKLEILNIRDELRKNINKLSLLKKDLRLISTSMSAREAEDRFLIIHSRENIENVEGIYMYLEDELEWVLLIKKEKISYYRYLKEYGIEQMRRLTTEYLNDLRRMHAQISNKVALDLIDKAIENTDSSLQLLDKAVEIVQQHSAKKGRNHQKTL